MWPGFVGLVEKIRLWFFVGSLGRKGYIQNQVFVKNCDLGKGGLAFCVEIDCGKIWL